MILFMKQIFYAFLTSKYHSKFLHFRHSKNSLRKVKKCVLKRLKKNPDAKSVWQHGEQQQQVAQQQLRHVQQQYAQRKEKLNAAVALDVKLAQKKEVLAAKRSEFEQTSAQQLQLTQQSQNLAAQVDESNRMKLFGV